MSQEKRPFSVSEHPPARTRPTTRTGVSQHARVCSGPATEKEGGSTVCRTEKSDRAASPAPAEIEVCAGAVLPDCCCTEPQALSPVPQPTDKTRSGSYRLEELGARKTQQGTSREKPLLLRVFPPIPSYLEMSL